MAWTSGRVLWWRMAVLLLVLGSLGAGAGRAAAAPGWTAYVGNVGDSTVTPITLATDTARAAIPVGSAPSGLAITPDGGTAYVTNINHAAVVPIDLATGMVKTAIPVPDAPFELAIAPGGKTAYVSDGSDNAVTPINLTTGTAGTEIPTGTDPREIAIAPSGKMAYVANVTANTVTPINLATDTPGTAIPVGTGPFGIAITPDGKTAYVADNGADAVTPIDLATDTAGAAIPVGAGPIGIAITPDGKSAYVVDYTGNTVTRLDTATNTAVGTAIQIGHDAEQIAITPDQAPTASFAITPAPAGKASSLDGSGSTSPVGSIAGYRWQFGDGETETTSSAVVAHAYSKPGVYTVRLTVTDTAGTSTEKVFTGQTVSNNGGPTATTIHIIDVKPAATVKPPTPTPTPGPTPAPPGPVPARLTHLSIAPRSASIAGRRVHGRCRAPGPGNRRDPSCPRAVHLRLAYTLTAPATLTLDLAQQHPGRRTARRCVPPSRHNRHDARCVRLISIPGHITETATAGSHVLVITGSFAGDHLAPGTYRLTAGPHAGTPKSVTFRIVR